MDTTKKNTALTRRSFLELGSAALSTAGVLAGATAATAMSSSATELEHANASTGPLTGKIALEEHFALAETIGASSASGLTSEARLQILEMGSGRIAEMDRGGVELCILSLVAPGIQGIPDTSQAIATARRANDYLAEHVAKNPKRLKGFAALPLQDPQAAAQELTRCVKELGFCGALAHGFFQIGQPDSAAYYDLPQYRPFWATVQQLDVPFYLHPRSPLASRQQSYEGHAWISGSPWGFAIETSVHALRLMGSGLFDEYPNLKVILGHMGENLPFGMWRIDNRIARGAINIKAKRSMSQYLRENFCYTTSGVFHTPALTNVIAEVGVDRVMYSVDYLRKIWVLANSGSTQPRSASRIASKSAGRTLRNFSACNSGDAVLSIIIIIIAMFRTRGCYSSRLTREPVPHEAERLESGDRGRVHHLPLLRQSLDGRVRAL